MKQIGIKLLSLFFVMIGGVAGAGLLLSAFAPVAQATSSADVVSIDPTPTPACPSGPNTAYDGFSTAVASPSTQTAGSPITVTVTIKNSQNCFQSGINVTLVSSGNPGAITIKPSTYTTPTTSSGIATFVLTATVAGTYNFTLSASPGSINKSVSVAYIPGPVDAGTSTVVASPPSVPCDDVTLSDVTVTLKDEYNNGVLGKTVSLASSRAAVDTILSPMGNTSSASGQVYFKVRSTVCGTSVYTATETTDFPSVEVAQTATVTYVNGLPSGLNSTVVAQTNSLPANNSTTTVITVTLRDNLIPGGNPVPGKVVSLTSSRGVTDTIGIISATTDVNGQAFFTVKSGTVGTSTYTAKDTTDNITLTDTENVTYVAGAVSSIMSTVVAAPTSLEADGVSTSTITVTLKDSSANPVSGKVVTITSSRGVTDTITTVSGTTNTAGQAAFTLKSSTPGSSVITAKDVTDSLFLTQTATDIFIAAGPDFFVKTNGSGTTCSQASPCKLTTALTQSVSGDNIYVAAGTYTGTGQAVISLTVSVALYGGWDGASSGGIVRDPNTYVSVLDAQDQRRVIYINASLTPTIDGFTITRGNAVGKPFGGWGGTGAGIFSQSANPIISNNVITHNTILTVGTPAGAGIYLFNASASSQIKGNVIISNTSGSSCAGYGGGILIDGSSAARLWNNTLTQNCAGVGSALAVYNSSPVITGNLFLKNDMASALYVGNSSALIQSNQILSNTRGGVFIYNTPATLDRNLIAYNTSTNGAGILSGNEGTQPFTVTNNIIYSNTATSVGGGFYIYASIFYPGPGAGVLLHNTFAKNSPAGIYADTFTSLTLTNNIIVTHSVGICVESGSLTVTVKADHTLFYGNSLGNTTGAGCDAVVTNTNALTGSAPLFANEAGGNYHLTSNSPAVNAGAFTGITTDYDGQTRGSLPDIGADEFVEFLVYLSLISK